MTTERAVASGWLPAGAAGWYRPLLVAGVAGGVGTSTWVRLVRLAGKLPVEDLGAFRGGLVDVLVTSNTAAATSRVGSALRACRRPPVLVVMHTVPGALAESRSYLRTVAPHIAARVDVEHHRAWLEMAQAPGDRWSPRMKDVAEAMTRFSDALRAMYGEPVPASAQAPPRPGHLVHGYRANQRHQPGRSR